MSKNVTINDKVPSPHVPPGASVGGNEYNKFWAWGDGDKCREAWSSIILLSVTNGKSGQQLLDKGCN